MRDDIREARRQIAATVSSYGLTEDEKEIVYNLAVKAYLKGYYQALKNVEKDAA